MKEVVFLNKNIERWKAIEKSLDFGKNDNPDFLADSFIKLTDDLSFAQTYFPGSETEKYLNYITSKFHKDIYKTKRENTGKFLTFWKFDFPLQIYHLRKYMLFSFIVFILSFILGIVSTRSDMEFTRIVLGDSYVNMTIENIKSGDPMGVYKTQDEMIMFLMIAKNNLSVMALIFLSGFFTSYFTGLLIAYNGVMVGAFQYFFYKYNVALVSVSTIWLHGTIEMFTMIVAGAAGILISNSLLFPGTYSRKQSLILGARRTSKIIIGLSPFIVFAAFIEGFITRHTEWSYYIKFTIIAFSLLVIIVYFFIYPHKVFKQNLKINNLKSVLLK